MPSLYASIEYLFLAIFLINLFHTRNAAGLLDGGTRGVCGGGATLRACILYARRQGSPLRSAR